MGLWLKFNWKSLLRVNGSLLAKLTSRKQEFPKVIGHKEDWQIPDFSEIHTQLLKFDFTHEESKEFFNSSREKLNNLHALFKTHGVDKEVAEHTTRKYDDFMNALTQFVRSL